MKKILFRGSSALGGRLRSASAVLGALLLIAVAAHAAPARAPGAPTSAPAARRAPTSLDNEPGYKRLFDPESASVAAGRRLNAPLISKPFTNGAASMDALGRAVCRSLHAGNRDSLLRLCITDTEFRDILWREFPQSRPATGLEWEDAWKILYARLHAGCGQALRDHGGHWYEFQRFEVDSVSRYRNFKLHSGLTLVAKDDQGGVQRWRWLRAVAERKGSFKIYSTDD